MKIQSYKNLNSPSSHGFTLLEVLLSVATIAILAGLSVPVWRTVQTKNDLDVATVTLAQTLRRAQVLSEAVDGDTSWGVKVQSGSITLFKGTSFAGRDTNFDEASDISTALSIAGVTEVVYAKFSGLPQTTGSTTLATANDARSVTLNEKGMVSY